MSSITPPIASVFYADSQQIVCKGTSACHYCGGPCSQTWRHGDPTPVAFSRSPVTAKKPESPWMCVACWMWRRKRTTVFPLSGGYKDGQCLLDHSTFITDVQTYVVLLPHDREDIYEVLLTPPKKFSLSLLEGEFPPKNLLQLQIVNEHAEVKADTELHFTINNIAHTYTVHELEETLINGDTGRMPGARALYRVLGPLAKMVGQKVEREKFRRGRPTVEERLARTDPREGKHNRVVTPDQQPEPPLSESVAN